MEPEGRRRRRVSWVEDCREDGMGRIPRVLPFFSGGAEGSGVADSFWSVCSGSLMLSSSFSSAMVTG